MRDRFENFTITILKLNKLVQKIKLYEMGEYGLKAIHVMCVYCLNSSVDGLTASDLAKHTLEDKAAISRALSLLKAKGYVCYDPKKYNCAVKLTKEGEKIASFVTERAHSAVEAGGDGLDDGRRAEFYRTLEQIAGNLTDYYESLIKNQKKG